MGLRMRRFAGAGAMGGLLVLVIAGTALGGLVNGSLPAAGFTFTSVTNNSVNSAGSGITPAVLATVEKYIARLSAVVNPTSAQRAALATYQARLADYKARYAAGIDLRAKASTHIKTTYSKVASTGWDAFKGGWHYHAGPNIVTVTVGTLTFYDDKCRPFDVSAGESYIESNHEVLDARILASKNTTGNTTVEWFTVRMYPAEALDPNPVAAPCTP